MRRQALTALLFCFTLFSATSFAQSSTPDSAKDAATIFKVLTDQEAAWNHGDIETFMRGYKNSPNTTFIGKTIAHGYQPILDRYKKSYTTREAMGTLDFSDLSVKMLGSDYAVVVGKYHLARAAASGGDASGIFSLIFEHEPEGWRIILDHSSSI